MGCSFVSFIWTPQMLEVDLSGPKSPVSGWTNPCGNGATLWLCLCALGGGPLIPGRFSPVAVLSSSCPSPGISNSDCFHYIPQPLGCSVTGTP